MNTPGPNPQVSAAAKPLRRKPQTPGRVAPPPIYVRRKEKAPAPVRLSSAQRTSVAAAAAEVAASLHAGGRDVCLCGACKHLLVLAARRHQVPAGAIVAQLRLTQNRPAATRPADAAPTRRALSAQVGTSAAVSVAGRRVSAAEGLIALALAAHTTDEPTGQQPGGTR